MDKELIRISSFLKLIHKELAKYQTHDIITFRMRIFDPIIPKNSTMLNRESFKNNILLKINKEFALLDNNRQAFCSLKIIPKKITTAGIFDV